MKERILLDLELIFDEVIDSTRITLFQSLVNEVMTFDACLSKQWLVDLQDTPLLLSIIQESKFFERWLWIDKTFYLSCIQSDSVQSVLDEVSIYSFNLFRNLFRNLLGTLLGTLLSENSLY